MWANGPESDLEIVERIEGVTTDALGVSRSDRV